MPSDLDEIRSFVSDTEKLLTDVISERDRFFAIERRQEFLDAWNEVRPRFVSVSQSLSGPGITAKLESVGLTGAQLVLKMGGFRQALSAFRNSDWAVKPLRKVLKWINSILGSLLGAIPGAEPIKELKEAIENELDED